MRRPSRIDVAGALSVDSVAIVFFVLAQRPVIGQAAPHMPGSRDPALIARGAALAATGNCQVSHMADRWEPYAGGLALTTPLGAIVASNNMPGLESGIGTWPFAACRQARTEGVDRAGQYLYRALLLRSFRADGSG